MKISYFVVEDTYCRLLFLGRKEECFEFQNTRLNVRILKGVYNSIFEVAERIDNGDYSSETWIDLMLKFLQRHLNIPHLGLEHLKAIPKLCGQDNFKLQLYLANLRENKDKINGTT